MSAPVKASMPQEVALDGGYQIQVTALDATTGDVVAGVNVSAVLITARNVGGAAPSTLEAGPFVLIPGPV